METTFYQLPIGARFEFRGRRYEKQGLSVAADENRCATVFQDEAEVFWHCKPGEQPGETRAPRPDWTSYLSPAPLGNSPKAWERGPAVTEGAPADNWERGSAKPGIRNRKVRAGLANAIRKSEPDWRFQRRQSPKVGKRGREFVAPCEQFGQLRCIATTFDQLAVGARFEFRGRRFEKMNAEIGRDEERGGNVFHARAEVLAEKGGR